MMDKNGGQGDASLVQPLPTGEIGGLPSNDICKIKNRTTGNREFPQKTDMMPFGLQAYRMKKQLHFHIRSLSSGMMMGVETPIPPDTINAAAPDGAPPRRIND